MSCRIRRRDGKRLAASLDRGERVGIECDLAGTRLDPCEICQDTGLAIP